MADNSQVVLHCSNKTGLADAISRVMAGRTDGFVPITVTVTIPGPLLRVQVNRWVRPDDIRDAYFDDPWCLVVVTGDDGKGAYTVGTLYLDNVCDVLGIEKPEESR